MIDNISNLFKYNIITNTVEYYGILNILTVIFSIITIFCIAALIVWIEVRREKAGEAKNASNFDNQCHDRDQSSSSSSTDPPADTSSTKTDPPRLEAGVMTTVDDLVAQTRPLVEGYDHPRDLEPLYNRLWHCLKWQQVDPDSRINLLVKDLYGLFVQHATINERWMMYNAVRQKLDTREFSRKACLIFLMHDADPEIVSTATQDLLYLSEAYQADQPAEIVLLIDILRRRFALCPGAVFGGALSFGEGRIAGNLKAMLSHISAEDVWVAAGIHNGSVHHATLQFWVALALSNVGKEDPASRSLMKSSARALVLAHQTAITPMVTDIERVSGAGRPEERVRILDQWSFDEYGSWMSKVLFDIEAREQPPAAFSEVLAEWGLRPRSGLAH